MLRAGSAQPAVPTARAGTPAMVVLGGTGCKTTEPAAIREHAPISILPRIFAPAPIAAADFRVPVAGLVTGAAESHILQDRNIVVDDACRPDYEAGRVIQEDAFANNRRWIDVGLEHVGRPALQIKAKSTRLLIQSQCASG
jgi:hypothetical protein